MPPNLCIRTYPVGPQDLTGVNRVTLSARAPFTSDLPRLTDILRIIQHVRNVPQRDKNRGKAGILKRTFRGPGTKIAASRTKQPAIISSNECGRLRIATHLVAALPAHSNERTPPAGAPAHRQLSN